MSVFIDRKYISLLSPKLDKFHQKSEYLWNFRCPICGDSQKNKLKMRGYVYRRKSDLFFTCHNCSTNLSFGNLLKTMDASLYKEYQMERFKNESGGNTAKPDFSKFICNPIFNKKIKIDLPDIDSLSEDHVAKVYIKRRNIPVERYSEIFYARNFREFILNLIPDYDKTLYEEERIVIPFYDENKDLLGVQGRALVNSKIKYITVKLHDDNMKVFGLDKLNKSRRVYVVEGPIDSMFLDNSIATMDASLYNIVPTLGSLDYVFIYDNEPRNKEIVKKMNKTIEMDLNICIWPTDIVSKDINEMISVEFKQSALIQSIIDTRTFSGLRARLEFETWRKF